MERSKVIKEAIAVLVEGQSLSQEKAAAAMDEVMSGEATPAQVGSFVTALRMKGETPEEITGMAQVMREKSLKVPGNNNATVDTCGTGGDGAGTFNISTAAAIVASAAGVPIAKHGNRAASGLCGSADILESLGVKIDLGPDGVQKCLEQVGFGFMFAPVFHPAMKNVAVHRREIGIRTVFNILGPLTNPAKAGAQVLGVANPSLGPKLAEVLKTLKTERAMIVHGEDGLDEFSLSAPTRVWDLDNKAINFYTIEPSQVGLKMISREEYICRTREEHISLFWQVLQGKSGAAQDVVALNAAATMIVSGKVNSLQDGVKLAQETIQSGAALSKFNDLSTLSRALL